MLPTIAWKSLLDRRVSVLLTVISIAVSTFVLLGVEHIRQEARSSFNRTVSGVDLIVGARTGQTNLLLYSVFHIGSASNNISWQSYQDISQRGDVAWTVPISLGDSHRGYRVVGTTQDLFHHFRYGNQQPLQLRSGKIFYTVHDAVVGAEVADALGYSVGDEIIIAHGTGSVSFSTHDNHPFTITGILERTGTPKDQTVMVSLAGIEAVHLNWPGGGAGAGFSPGFSPDTTSGTTADTTQPTEEDLIPDSITAFYVGLESRLATFRFQREVNDYRQEPLLAILPGVALSELWQMLGVVENVLAVIALFVLLAALLGMTTMLLATIQQRQREIAVFRAIGARPAFLFLLIQVEAVMIVLAGLLVGALSLTVALIGGQHWLATYYGLFIGTNILTADNALLMAKILAASALLATLPAVSAYRRAIL